MMLLTDKSKVSIRKSAKNRSFDPDEKRRFDTSIMQNLLPFLKKASNVSVYVSTQTEVDTWNIIQFLLQNNKQVFVPKWDEERSSYGLVHIESTEELVERKNGILQPTARGIFDLAVDLWIIPGIAFDQSGVRLGRGSGHYDRLLQNSKGLRIGLCYERSLYQELPHDSWDISMNKIITERGVYDCQDT